VTDTLRDAIEHTLLKPEATRDQYARLCDEAVEHGLFGVCVPSLFVPLAKSRLEDGPTTLVTVVGFPLGYSPPAIKAEEARRAVGEGADEVDMVIAVGIARGGEWAAVAADVRAVHDACAGRPLKVILETGFFDEPELQKVARAALDGGAEFLKTSTGFGPRGASVRDIEVLADVIAHAPACRANIKASGGIRTAPQALALLRAGAARIGTSNGVAMVSTGSRSKSS
jgi:deoxyribose-phosphate aldolase